MFDFYFHFVIQIRENPDRLFPPEYPPLDFPGEELPLPPRPSNNGPGIIVVMFYCGEAAAAEDDKENEIHMQQLQKQRRCKTAFAP